ncbi:LysM peptidoglycan-binding and 3D domain-containing protein [Lysinibacillus fusiformis]|uniref:LysM peptidoglycan-binding and 3D domain-containing protein n=1 Tax=Lysinibacillus fusiformis TaxID=28031 RepID=UPI000880E970|nr:3D domain-containing protein [Lysinibacillus fusiformis]SCX60834.1 3D (Asp-Asp-Asp) domain-containing protein [Lysinibacillus fusiformis]SDB38412.1 3D (Asp-Asp-Asp) domain-containing protein [Lysinibacillus fusiformis]SFI47543.1 3D (Asp-Asp-Asp) domain-containing protein [Lysinibacillus fusiformis]SFT03206.1 3D (Asp-Asp-Asp) domain-containing protein [Lysinibacillus fusiformis]
MLKKIISIVPVAMLSATLGANAQAATINVQKGDTLWDLSRTHHTSVENIKTLNHMTTNLIHPGDVLTIAQQYTVKQGDTLWDIALDHQVSVSQIKEWNQLQTDLIHPGLHLSIIDGTKTSKAVTDKPIKPAAHAAKETTTSITNNTTAVESKPEETVSSTSNTAPKDSAPEATAPSTSTTASKENAPEANKTASKEIIVEASAYTASCEGCSGITATGMNLKANPNAKVISVDPAVIPLGSKVYVEGYGEAIAGDTGGAIKGKRIDVFFPSQQDAINFGVKQIKVTILD